MTVVAFDALAGENVHASAPELPAATPTKTPLFARLFSALFTDALNPPPSDKFATAGLVWFAATQSIPAITDDQLPEPAQFSTLTPYRLTSLATPYVSA